MPRTLSTSARTVWPKGQRPNHIKGTRLALPAGVAARYQAKLQRLAAQMTATTERELKALFRHPDVVDYISRIAPVRHAMDISPASQARILTNKLALQFEELFQSAAKPYASDMVDEADGASKAAVGMSLRELSKGLEFKLNIAGDLLDEFKKAVIANNVSLIKSIPSEYFRDVQQAVLSAMTDGRGLEDLVPFFDKAPGEQSRRAKNIAQDQVHKAYNGLNKVRLVDAGVKKFQWIHSGGGLHPREHHIDPAPAGLNGGVFSFDKLPIIDPNTGERGIPGQAINCRCTMTPVVEV